jgi:hypothetical protein
MKKEPFDHMINVWGICIYGAGSYDQMTRWKLSCIFFSPGKRRRVADIKNCCANCIRWLVWDEPMNDGDEQ